MNRAIHEMLEAYQKRGFARLHMPGHKGKPFAHDLTELEQTDDLSNPAGTIGQTNREIAGIYRMPWASMCTCGSTACIQAMLLAARGKLLIGRNAHKSVIHGVMNFGLDAEFFADCSTGGILQALKETSAEALFVTAPDYYGNMVDADAICRAAAKKGMQVFFDCAHGAHFPFSSRFPDLPTLADAFCVSAHKTLPFALTQAAVLLGQRDLSKQLFSVHTTSPSFLILESMEQGFAWMADNAAQVERWIDACPEEWSAPDDPTRLVVSVPGYSGFDVYKHYQNYGVVGEMADRDCAVFLTSPIDMEGIAAFCRVPRLEPRGRKAEATPACYGEKAMEPREVKGKAGEWIELKRSVGRIAAAAVGLYPPGVANLLPGERVTRDVVQYLQDGALFGSKNGKIEVIK